MKLLSDLEHDIDMRQAGLKAAESAYKFRREQIGGIADCYKPPFRIFNYCIVDDENRTVCECKDQHAPAIIVSALNRWVDLNDQRIASEASPHPGEVEAGE